MWLLLAALVQLACSSGPTRRPLTDADMAMAPRRGAGGAAVAGSDPAAMARLNEVAPQAGLLDTAVVERMVGRRLRAVEMNALRDALGAFGRNANVDVKPVRDLTGAVAALALGLNDARARSQSLGTSLFRAGLSLMIAQFTAASPGIPDQGCAPAPTQTASRSVQDEGGNWGSVADDPTRDRLRTLAFRADAVYEALASTRLLRNMGFPESDGVVPSQCVHYVATIRDVIDGEAAVGETLAARGAAQQRSQGAIEQVEEARRHALSECEAPASREGLPDALFERLRVTLTEGNADDFFRAVQDSGFLGEGGTPCKTALEALVTAIGDPDRHAPPAPAVGVTPQSALIHELGSALPPGPARTAVELLANAPIEELLSVVDALSKRNGRAVDRGDVVAVVRWIRTTLGPFLDAHPDDRAVAVMRALLDTLPQAIREDGDSPGTVRIELDAAALVSATTAAFNSSAAGWYLRATVGTGYAYVSAAPASVNSLQPAFYEELGAGRRCRNFLGSFGFEACAGSDKVLSGWQVVTSGLLYRITSQAGLENRVFAGAGVSFNFYRLLDLSLNAGVLYRTQHAAGDTSGSDVSFGAFVGFQLPLPDYLEELTSGSTESSQTSTRGSQ